MKLLYTVAKGFPIYGHTKVLSQAPRKAITDHGEITYKKLIVATHFPMLNKHGLYFLKLYQHRSCVIALKGAACMDGSNMGLSFRGFGDLLLVGGGL